MSDDEILVWVQHPLSQDDAQDWETAYPDPGVRVTRYHCKPFGIPVELQYIGVPPVVRSDPPGFRNRKHDHHNVDRKFSHSSNGFPGILFPYPSCTL